MHVCETYTIFMCLQVQLWGVKLEFCSTEMYLFAEKILNIILISIFSFFD